MEVHRKRLCKIKSSILVYAKGQYQEDESKSQQGAKVYHID